jgi:multidrug resistance efflux pump
MTRKLPLVVLALAALGAVGYRLSRERAHEIVLTGLVTTNDVVVSPQIAGRLSELRVTEGDSVAPGQVLATLEPSELRADRAFYQASAEAMTAQLSTLEDELAASEAQQREAQANLTQAKQQHERVGTLLAGGGATQREEEDARTAVAVAQARVDAADRQVSAKRSALAAARRQQAAAGAQTDKADVRLGYTEVTAPIGGTVSVRAARQGEMLNPGQPILTLVNPDSLWVRADVEETYIDRVRLGDSLTVRLPSGAELPGVVTYRGVDADFATQRDVSRTKRDIKTFELRLRVDNRERRLAVGMTAYVLLPVGQQ